MKPVCFDSSVIVYDAVFLATAETAPNGPAELWTGDRALVKAVGDGKQYVRALNSLTEPY